MRKLQTNWTLGGPNCIQALKASGQLEERKAQALANFRAFIANEEAKKFPQFLDMLEGRL